jgi:hypothetical protein
MANDKDFILKNAVEVGGPTNVTLGTVTSDDIDLSTGNYFKDTPSGTSTYTISNAGDVQSFQLEVTGGTEEVAQNFSTTIYTGDSANRDIVNNIDLSTSKVAKAEVVLSCAYSVAIAVVPSCVITISVILRSVASSAVMTALIPS